MKLVRYGKIGKEKPGLIDEDGKLRDISHIVDDLAGKGLSPKSLAKIRDAKVSKLPLVKGKPRLGSCVARPGNFIAVGLNYADHAAETGAPIPKEPILFNKAPNCVVGPYDDVVIPKNSVKTDWEVEIAIVVGSTTAQVAEADVMAHIAGFCICNDVSEREWQAERGGQWMKGKSAPTFGPLGPWLVTPDEIADVQKLDMWLDIDGDRMQKGSTATMIFTIRQIVSYISMFMTLDPGDVITTGTPPGVGLGIKPPRYLKAGETMSLGIEGLGMQAQRVVAYGEE